MGRLSVFCATVVAFCQPSLVLAAEKACAPGELRTDSTPHSISIEWDLAGDADYDAACSVQYRAKGADAWREALPLFRVDNRRRFDDLQSFAEAVGIERHAVRVRKEEIFANWTIPAAPARIGPPDLTLKGGSRAVDAGAVVPNLGDDFVGKAPDLGACEYGRAMPLYGPRRQSLSAAR